MRRDHRLRWTNGCSEKLLLLALRCFVSGGWFSLFGAVLLAWALWTACTWNRDERRKHEER